MPTADASKGAQPVSPSQGKIIQLEGTRPDPNQANFIIFSDGSTLLRGTRDGKELTPLHGSRGPEVER